MGELYQRCRRCFYDGDKIIAGVKQEGRKEWGKRLASLIIAIDHKDVACGAFCPACHAFYGVRPSGIGTTLQLNMAQLREMVETGCKGLTVKLDYTKAEYESAKAELRIVSDEPLYTESEVI